MAAKNLALPAQDKLREESRSENKPGSADLPFKVCGSSQRSHPRTADPQNRSALLAAELRNFGASSAAVPRRNKEKPLAGKRNYPKASRRSDLPCALIALVTLITE
jgi:hypothetical protein